MRARLLSLLWLPYFLFVSIFLTLPAFAGNWGENWGEMTWGEMIAAVPLTGKVGFLFLVFGLLGVVLWRFRSRVATGAILLALMVGGANFAEAQVSVPNTFTDGDVADAEAMNANFEAVQGGLNLALTSADVTGLYQFENGTTADANEVNANFTALVDGVNTALSNRETDCVAAGGTWDAATSTCTAASSYNCFVGGYCSAAAVEFPPETSGYINKFGADTQTTEPALSAGCNVSTGNEIWNAGMGDFEVADFPHIDIPNGITYGLSMCQ